MIIPPDILATLIALAACLALGVFSWRQHTRMHESVKPRMIPWMIISMACLATGFMIVVHFVNLLGFETGRR